MSPFRAHVSDRQDSCLEQAAGGCPMDELTAEAARRYNGPTWLAAHRTGGGRLAAQQVSDGCQ